MKHPPAVASPESLTFDAKLDRVADDAFLAQLMASSPRGNRAERREEAREMRLGLKRLRAWAHGIKAKREARALRKARRAARVARIVPASL